MTKQGQVAPRAAVIGRPKTGWILPVVLVGGGLAGIALYRKAGRHRPGPAPRHDARRPSWARLLAEIPAAGRLAAAQLGPVPISDPAVGRGRPVLVIPGFLASDLPTLLLRRTLKASGFSPYGWRNGVNLGMRRDMFDRLEARLDRVIQQVGAPVALVGWSLGGLYVRELAKRRPADVSVVVTLGSPFSVDLHDNNAWKLYEAINDHSVDDPPVDVRVDQKPPVRTVAIWSSRDGIVAPASASGQPWESDETLQVDCKHNELVSNPDALATLVRVLGEADDRRSS